MKIAENKLETAEQLRQKAILAVLEKAKKTSENLHKVQERNNLVVKRKGEKIDNKLESAEQLRQQALLTVLEKAKKTSEKITKAQENRTLVVKRKGEKIETKLETADQLRCKVINQKVEAARRVTNKISKVKEAKELSHQQRERSLKAKLEKVTLCNQKSTALIEETALKAKTYSNKVQKMVNDHKEKLAQSSQNKCLEIVNKLQKSDAKRVQHLEEIVQKAKQSAQKKTSQSVDQENDQ